jgi:hypothetical protein
MPTIITGETGVNQITNGVITADDIASGAVTAAKLATGAATSNLSAGSVLQVVQGSFTTQVSTSSSTYSDTGITATITPSSSSNKILVFSSVLGCLKQLSNTKIGLRLVRGATTVDTFSTETARSTDYGANAQIDVGTISSVNLDSPATTSAVTYKIQFASVANTSNVQINNVNGTTVGSTLTLMEIKG